MLNAQISREIRLKNRSEGLPSESDFEFAKVTLAPVGKKDATPFLSLVD